MLAASKVRVLAWYGQGWEVLCAMPRRRGGTSRRNVSSTASAKQYLLSLSLLLPSLWYIGEPEDAAIPAPEAAAALVGAPFIRASAHH